MKELQDTGLKPSRGDGAEARTRLLDAAMQLFAEQGFSKTSIRDIANAAQVNVSSISYYFGDKAGLYRACFNDPRTNPDIDFAQLTNPDTPLRTVFHLLIKGMVDPLKLGNAMQSCAKLHFREMLEPTGVWLEEIDRVIRPAHTGLVDLLCKHLGLTQADDDVHRLAFSISGLGVMLMVNTDPMQVLRPSLVASAAAIDAYTERMADFAMAMFENERTRRQHFSHQTLPHETPNSN
jgi:AcrR family transcriptional regulator